MPFWDAPQRFCFRSTIYAPPRFMLAMYWWKIIDACHEWVERDTSFFHVGFHFHVALLSFEASETAARVSKSTWSFLFFLLAMPALRKP